MTLDLQTTIEQMKAEIFAYIQQAVIPSTVASFSELHDYIDANCLGGFCDEDHETSSRILELQEERDNLTEEQERNWPHAGELDELQEEQTNFVNAAQNAIDAWIKAGGCKGLLRYAVHVSNGMDFYLTTEKKARAVANKEHGEYLGLQIVPMEKLPPSLARMYASKYRK